MRRFVVSGFLNSFAQAYFATRPKTSLLRALSVRLDAISLSQALASDCRPLQHLVWQRLAALPEDEQASLIAKCLHDDPQLLSHPALLRAIAHPSIGLSEEILAKVDLLLDSADSATRLAAAALLALRQPRTVWLRLQREEPIEAEVLRRFCWADDPALIEPLMTAFGAPRRNPPPTIGFLVTPEWLAENYARQPTLVEWLVRHCGYCDDEITPQVLNLLSAGFSYVTSRMTGEPRMTKIAHRWQRRIRSFMWRLLPDELDLERDDAKPFDIQDPLEIDLFMAAVRDSDRLAFRELWQQPPFSPQAVASEPAPVCFHGSSQYVRRLVVSDPLAWATRQQIPLERQGEYLLEKARVLIEPKHETRLSADLSLRGRWVMKTTAPTGTAVTSHPVAQAKSSPRTIIIGDFETPAADESLSPGANSVVALAAACGLDYASLGRWLGDAEARWSRCLLPIGIEVQVPLVDADCFAGWKAALPFLGVPSPIRPEFGSMVEAAFRPARTFHAMALGPLLLQQLGLIAKPQDMALHVSLQAELGDDVRWLAFPQHFIHPSVRLRNKPDRAMTRVMSKGYVCVHQDAEILSSDLQSPTRTELRLFRILANEVTAGDPSAVELDRGYISDLIAVHVLGSSQVSPCVRCRDLFCAYTKSIEQIAQAMPQEFSQLLASNYFEATGDPRDAALLPLLPIFRHWSAARRLVHANDLAGKLDLQFRALRNQHVQGILNHWRDEHELDISEIAVGPDEIELAIPQELPFGRTSP